MALGKDERREFNKNNRTEEESKVQTEKCNLELMPFCGH
jgi:hypothetical protein